MSDYISRGTFIANCEGWYCSPCKEQGKDANGVRCRACWVDDMLLEVEDAPAADVEPVRHGRWVDYMVRDWRCSECGQKIIKVRNVDGYCYNDKPNYCPNCGAKMDLEEENNDD